MRKREDARQETESPDSATVLTRGGAAVRVSGTVRVSISRPCVIDSRGVTLYRWPRRSILIPHERVDRFEVVVFDEDFAPIRPDAEGGGWYYLERLALLSREGKALPVWGPVTDVFCRWHGPSIHARAQRLNNLLARWRVRDAPEIRRGVWATWDGTSDLPSVSPPAGWYRDPFARHAFRYWDGATWTTAVSEAGDVGQDAPAPSGDEDDGPRSPA